jgi:hypothetical protein
MRSVRFTRRTFVTGVGAAGAATLVGGTPPASAAPVDTGQWTAPATISGEAIHAVLMHNGEVLFFSYIEGNPDVDHTSYVGTWDYRTGVSRDAPLPYDRDIFCCGMNSLPDGRQYVAGGHDPHTGQRSDPNGVLETDVYNPANRTWTRGPLMSESRWYPTNVGLPSGRSLVLGGGEEGTKLSVTIDSYDPSTNRLTTLPGTANRSVGMYPRLLLAPDGRLAKVGPARATLFFNTQTNSWGNGPSMLFGTRQAGGVVLLSGGDRVLTFGGRPNTSGGPTVTSEILNLTGTPRWQSTGSLNHARVHANGVVLPDGTVLAVGGGQSSTRTGPQRIAELYDPATGRWTDMAAQVASRMYHSTALLLPDARVFSGGQQGTHARTVELFSPPYLFRGPRPVISSAGTTVARGGSLSVSSAQAASIRRVALVKPGAVTHQVNTDQRHLLLTFTTSGSTLTARLPSNTMLTPPGYYMVFILDTLGVPSVASWVRVT